MSPSRSIALSIVCVATACGKSARQREREDLAALEAWEKTHLGELRATCNTVLGAAAADAPRLATDGVADVPALRIEAGGNASVITQSGAWTLVHPESSATPPLTFRGPDVRPAGFLYQACEWAVSEQRPDGVRSVATAEAALAKASSVQYVLAVRLVEFRDSQVAASTLVPGHAVLEVRVLDAHGGLHGGFRFTADNSAEISYHQDLDSAGHSTTNDMYSAISSDLNEHAETALKEAIARYLPGSALGY